MTTQAQEVKPEMTQQQVLDKDLGGEELDSGEDKKQSLAPDTKSVDSVVDNSGRIPKTSSGSARPDSEKLAKVSAKRKARAAEEKPKKRGRPSKAEQAKVAEQQISTENVLVAMFSGISNIMLLRGMEPLSKREIQEGVVAFTPMIDKYGQKLVENSVFVYPIIWTGNVVLSRSGLMDNQLEEKDAS